MLNLKNIRLYLWLALNAAYLRSSRAQEMPKYSEVPFTNITHRTNLCSLSMKYVMGEIKLNDVLRGIELSVGINDYVPEFLSFNAEGALDTEKPGLFPILLDELARRAGFNWRNSYGRVLSPFHPLNEGRLVDGVPVTWTHVMVDAIERYDLLFAEWAHSLERKQKGIGFTTGWFDASIILIQGESQSIKPSHAFSFFLFSSLTL